MVSDLKLIGALRFADLGRVVVDHSDTPTHILDRVAVDDAIRLIATAAETESC